MPLLIDGASSARQLNDSEFRNWSQGTTVFISSEMGELGDLRRRLTDALRELGLTVIVFEDLGGRDDDAETAFLDGVSRSDIYLGVVADRYGSMQASGRSPTHEEYLAARNAGKRIAVWVAGDDSNRQGNAKDFVQELQAFHTTGVFDDIDSLISGVVNRLKEIAANDEAPWIKVGDAIFRAEVIRDQGETVVAEAEVRDAAISQYLLSQRPDQWGRGSELRVTTASASGVAQVAEVASEIRSNARNRITLTAAIAWNDGSGDSMAMGASGLSSEDLAELGLRHGLLGDPLPESVRSMAFLVPGEDPLAELGGHALTDATYAPIARLLVVEHLLGKKIASHIKDFLIGPAHGGTRRVRLEYREPERFSNVDPEIRLIEGTRPSSG